MQLFEKYFTKCANHHTPINHPAHVTHLTHVLLRDADLALPNVKHLVDHRAAGQNAERQRQAEERLQQHQILDVVAQLVALHRHAKHRRIDAEGRTAGGDHQPAQRRRLDGREVEEGRFRCANVGFLFLHLLAVGVRMYQNCLKSNYIVYM